MFYFSVWFGLFCESCKCSTCQQENRSEPAQNLSLPGSLTRKISSDQSRSESLHSHHILPPFISCQALSALGVWTCLSSAAWSHTLYSRGSRGHSLARLGLACFGRFSVRDCLLRGIAFRSSPSCHVCWQGWQRCINRNCQAEEGDQVGHRVSVWLIMEPERQGPAPSPI